MGLPLPLQGLHSVWRDAVEGSGYSQNICSINARESLELVMGYVETNAELTRLGSAALFASNVFFASRTHYLPQGSPELRKEALRALADYEDALRTARPSSTAMQVGLTW
jgi:hypothetical protein